MTESLNDLIEIINEKNKAKAFLERELLVERAGSKGWSITDDGTLISCHATSQDVMAEAFRLSEKRDPPIRGIIIIILLCMQWKNT